MFARFLIEPFPVNVLVHRMPRFSWMLGKEVVYARGECTANVFHHRTGRSRADPVQHTMCVGAFPGYDDEKEDHSRHTVNTAHTQILFRNQSRTRDARLQERNTGLFVWETLSPRRVYEPNEVLVSIFQVELSISQNHDCFGNFEPATRFRIS